MKRDDLLNLLEDHQVRGLWSDTLFPALKDLVSYGADHVQSSTVDEWVDAALDTALYTLSSLAPELAPGMIAMRKMVNRPAHNAAQNAKEAIKEWAIGSASRQRIRTTQPSLASKNVDIVDQLL